MSRNKLTIAILTWAAFITMRFSAILVRMLGHRLARDIDPNSGKDRKTGARLT